MPPSTYVETTRLDAVSSHRIFPQPCIYSIQGIISFSNLGDPNSHAAAWGLDFDAQSARKGRRIQQTRSMINIKKKDSISNPIRPAKYTFESTAPRAHDRWSRMSTV
jgi:hypothetical protein